MTRSVLYISYTGLMRRPWNLSTIPRLSAADAVMDPQDGQDGPRGNIPSAREAGQ